MRVLVTGASSMIGISLIDACISHQCEVLGIVRENTRRLEKIPNSNLVRIEFANIDHLEQIEGDGKPYDVFYHFAWGHTAKAERNDPVVQEDNIRRTLEAVKVAKNLGCKKFIGAGSQAEYGIVNDIIREDTTTNPVTAYGISKLAAGLLSRNLCEQLGMEHIWARIFSVYGPHDNEGTMLNTAIDDFIAGRTAHFSAATQMWNYLYESDAGEMFYQLGSKKLDEGMYFVAHPESMVLRDYIIQMMDEFGLGARGSFGDKSSHSVTSLNVDPAKSISAIGISPKISFREGIRRTIEYRKTMRYD